LTSCSGPTPSATAFASSAPASEGVSFIDALGHVITVSDPQRVTVCPASFAHVWQLAGGEIAATTSDSFDPGSAVTPSDDIKVIGSAHNPNLELILAEESDFVILSKTTPGHEELYESLNAANVTTAYFSVETFDEYLDMLKICSDITNRSDLYETNGLNVKKRIDAAIETSKGKPSPRILFLRAYSTNVTAKNSDGLAGTIFRDMGCENVADSDDWPLESLSMESIILADPDYIFAVTMGDADAANATLSEITRNPAWNGLTAVKNGRFRVLPKELFQLKPNNRWGESYETVADILYSE
jgi:iron complex transport system substrate-binding protein